MPRPLSATLSLGALRNNLAVTRRFAPRASVLAVIKANAYGHGLLRAAQAMRGADGFALLELDAAVALREAGFTQRIVMLEGFFDARDLLVLAEYKLGAVVHSADQLELLGALPAGSGLDVLLKINTGMNRLGFAPAEFPAALAVLQTHPAVAQITLMTHFANADDERGVAWQMAEFERLAAGLKLPCSLANSAAVLRYPETHGDWVRPGIMLYGCSPFVGVPASEFGLKPVMTLGSEIIATRQLKRGDSVGYGGMFSAGRDMRIGIVACGYADGYPRHAPNGTPVAVDGRLTGTVGRVSMDMLCVDLSALPHAGPGSRVVLWGEGNPVEDVAHASGTLSYELLCALAPRVPVAEHE
ncbi:MAG: alanine racemase [Hydrogenophaga sp.]|uniref:alanine racemase n=1 Tax=Hydrogenophaga sp. TaxID=1904254 RepID=UPI002732229D|nr:alanine racemase [Hydrogenophaga sp.]MDP2164675.1 alanine racemase [Hydrogenophaga sp.]